VSTMRTFMPQLCFPLVGKIVAFRGPLFGRIAKQFGRSSRGVSVGPAPELAAISNACAP
jgi:hypothetical protein